MINLIYQLIRTARPRQWLKNASLFAAPIFMGTLFKEAVLTNVFHGFIAFCIASSGIYFLNDIADLERDRKHPIKKNRPMASGALSVPVGKLAAFFLMTTALVYSYVIVGTYFTYAILIYFLIQIAYSAYFRNVIIIDSLFVATGFTLRVFAGGFAADSSISSWLILTTIGLSMLLAFGKRRSEKTILLKQAESKTKNEIDTRKTLRSYPDTLLDSMISISATFCLMSYALFTFQTSSQIITETVLLPSILRGPKWMMLTIPLVIYGVARYLYVIYEKEAGESPERVLIADKPLLLAVLLWGTSTMFIIYWLPLFV